MSDVEVNHEWMAPQEALRRIAPLFESDMSARQALADALHQGTVHCSAAKIMENDDFDPTDPWPDLVQRSSLVGHDSVVDPSTFRMSPTWPDETRHWDWRTGNFVICSSDDPAELFSGCLLEGTAFLREDVLRLVGVSDRAGAGGPKADLARWNQLWARFVFTEFGEVDFEKKFSSENRIREALQDAAAGMDKPFSRNNLDSAIKAIWDEMVLRQTRGRRNPM